MKRQRGRERVVTDLIKALEEEAVEDGESGFVDVFLTSSDGVEVGACRFVLASRSRVLKRMLYGSFREAKSSTICMMGYESAILRAVVSYCRANDIDSFVSSLDLPSERGIRRLVELSKAADYLELDGMKEDVDRLVRRTMLERLPLSCAVLDQADVDSSLWRIAFNLIECRPYVCLDSSNITRDAADDHVDDEGRDLLDDQYEGGGIQCLQPDRLIAVMKNQSLAAGELFLFRMIRRWFNVRSCNDSSRNSGHVCGTASTSSVSASDVARKCCRSLNFEYIEPQSLLEEVQGCRFVSPDWIFGAVAKQALRASSQGVWSLGCRGPPSVNNPQDRVLVENCGRREANGLYFRVAGLANSGGLYSKREVASGQQHVYTLSCSVKNDWYDCRLFCTPLLTHRAVEQLRAMQQTSVIDPVFQPVLQVLAIDPPKQEQERLEYQQQEDQFPSSHQISVPAKIRKYYRGRLSDGHLHLHATFAASVQTFFEEEEIEDYSVIKVLEFGLYLIDGLTGMHVTKLSVVNCNPGQQFGNPVGTSITPEDDAEAYGDDSHSDATVSNVAGLYSLYSCNAEVKLVGGNTAGAGGSDVLPVPRSGWNVEGHGVAPSPTCTWLPASASSEG